MEVSKELLDSFREGLNTLMTKQIQTTTQLTSNHYTGRVVNNNDPDKVGRCQIRVFGIFGKEINDDELPWATPDQSYIGGLKGNFIVPTVDTIVRVYFENNEIYKPIYTTKVLDLNNMDFDSNKNEDYPNTQIFFETNEGDYFKINRTTRLMTFKHSSGAIITIDKDGVIDINSEITDKGHFVINVNGDVDIYAGGNAKVDAKSDVVLGRNPMAQLINNLPNCLVTGAPHYIGNTNVKC